MAVSVPPKLPMWELTGDLDMEARVLVGLRSGVERLSIPSSEQVWGLAWRRPWRDSEAG